MSQQNALLQEIKQDQTNLAKIKTVNSMGDELKVSFGPYEGSKNGWNAYLSLYSDGILVYTDTVIVSYEAVAGKKAPNMETELNDAVIEEYTNNVDMYNSLLTRGDPILYFEIITIAMTIITIPTMKNSAAVMPLSSLYSIVVSSFVLFSEESTF